MLYLSVKDELIRELGKSFDTKIRFDKRLTVMSDLLLFRPKEDVSVWKQKKGEAPEYFTVYFDDVFICGFSADEPIEKANLEFWKGFKEKYARGEIRLNPKTEDVIVVEKPVVKKRKPSTPEEKLAAEVVERLNK